MEPSYARDMMDICLAAYKDKAVAGISTICQEWQRVFFSIIFLARTIRRFRNGWPIRKEHRI